MTSKAARLVFFTITIVGLFAACLVSGIVHAAEPAAAAPADPGSLLQSMFDAVQGRHWWILASTVVVGVTWLLRTGVARKSTSWLAWFDTDRGGVALTAIVSILGGLATALGAEHAPGGEFLLSCLKIFIGAIGQYVAIKKLAKPADKVGA